ncbi:MAG: response regulator [Planctomycetota bacterium]
MAKVLVVDDSRLTRRIECSALEAAGHECVQASDGEEGLTAFRKESPDCVLTDLLMPNLDGFGLIEAIRATDERTPILVASADIQQSSTDRCIALGVECVLTKPLKGAQLADAVGAAIRGQTTTGV